MLCRGVDSTNRLYLMSRHFVWLVPLVDLLLFLVMGAGLALVARLWPRRGGRISLRLLAALAVWPALMVAVPGIYASAWFVLALGLAWRAVPLLERNAAQSRGWLLRSFPALLGLVAVVAGLVSGEGWFKQRREMSRPLPAAGSPNVLLIVLDTVRADRTSLYGYNRPTTPALEKLARRGIRFEEARATAPWTLPSHASMFTGRWPHELDVRWMSPLHMSFPTLSEYLGESGYATAGFVGNTLYCSYDTGLDRGFGYYEDYVVDLPRFRFLRMALLADRLWSGVSSFGLSVYRNLGDGPVRTWLERVLRPLLAIDRKDAGLINKEFLDWLSRRPQEVRPFFAFLNYFDAHSPYLPPEGSPHRFGLAPATDAEVLLLKEFWATVDKLRLTPHFRLLFQDAYDNCLGYLDERLGLLLDELERRGVLDRTVVIVTADHGEELGDHSLFDHGESLYRPEIRVPLLFVLPSSDRAPANVKETVSLRDLPATIADLSGLAAGSPFPGRSLSRLWRRSGGEDATAAGSLEGAISELSAPNPSVPSRGRSPAARGPLVSLAEGDYVYIRNEGTGREELFNSREDPRELTSRAGVQALQPMLERLREDLERIRPGRSGSSRQ
jgi:arylsulfatase A-like enzyme